VSVPAWLLDLGADRRAAVAFGEQLHLIHQPEVFAVATAPAHCAQVLFIGARCVPVFDPLRWFDAGAGEPAGAPRCAGVYQYRPVGQATVDLGAIWLAAPPRRIEVEDSMSAALPHAETERWRAIAHGCVADAQGLVPILDLARVFAPQRPSDRQRDRQ
jgi:hypothetical protein